MEFLRINTSTLVSIVSVESTFNIRGRVLCETRLNMTLEPIDV
uniref:Uncharacterized protein n=1 Tax=Musa acuminata subsp. malaccensis TaxID=214687 RepID=A0A804L236_MUSAM